MGQQFGQMSDVYALGSVTGGGSGEVGMDSAVAIGACARRVGWARKYSVIGEISG